MPRPDVIPYPVPNGNFAHAVECRPLSDGAMRCEPVYTNTDKWFGVFALAVLAIALIWWLIEWSLERRQRRLERALLNRWRSQLKEPACTTCGRRDKQNCVLPLCQYESKNG